MQRPIRRPPGRAAKQTFLLALASQFRCTEGFYDFIRSVVTPTASVWNDSCRAGFASAEDARLCTAHIISAIRVSSCADTVSVPVDRRFEKSTMPELLAKPSVVWKLPAFPEMVKVLTTNVRTTRSRHGRPSRTVLNESCMNYASSAYITNARPEKAILAEAQPWNGGFRFAARHYSIVFRNQALCSSHAGVPM
jgi:hypothetical protein